MNNKFNLNNLLFAFVVLTAVALGKITQEKPFEPILHQEIKNTSVTASMPAAIFPAVQPAVSAAVVLAKNLHTDETFFARDLDKKWALASLTKLMTAVIAAEKLNPDDKVEISESAVAAEGIAGGFTAGETVKIRDLLNALLGVSSNDAAEQLADYYGRTKFIDAMREKAGELGMRLTDFSDPSGLSLLNQSAAADIEKLMRYILNNRPELLEITRQTEFQINGRTLMNINQFAGRNDFLGGKTGFTDEAGGNLVSLFRLSGSPILIIVLGSEDRFSDTEIIYDYLRNY